ncbi:co-chaperonin GroES [Neisseria gonorrhoeae]|uniref:Co-chaperonin GroES n=1 Tax=Neisseria gonorrhoeae TaxID=485 RepID=A0A378W1P8_NEIGO|nr:co-chaperonin GroES [Neisseria gonorrhoeae]
MGEVIAVGAGKIGKDGARRPLDVKAGDKSSSANTAAKP